MENFVIILILFNAIALAVVIWLARKNDRAISQMTPYLDEIGKMRQELVARSNQIISTAIGTASQIESNSKIIADQNVANSVELSKQAIDSAKAAADKAIETYLDAMKALEKHLKDSLESSISEGKQEIQNITKDSLKNYQDSLLENLKALQEDTKITKEKIFQESSKEISELGKMVPQQLISLRQEIVATTQDKLKEAEKEIETYKSENLKSIDEGIYQILTEIAKKTLGKIIDTSTHEELVIQALEKAKKEKLL